MLIILLTVKDVSKIYCFCFTFCSIEEDYVPKPGDVVKFKKSLIPPKNEKFQAVHVKITHAKEGVEHESWDAHMPHH